MPNRTPRPARPRASASPRRGSRWLVVAGYVGLALGCVLLAAITFLVVAAPVDLVRDRLVQQISYRTGRDLMVAGPTSLSVFPRLALSLGDVTLSAPRGMGGDPTLKVERLEAELGLSSLFTGQAAVKHVTLTRPAVELRVDAQGRRSWDVASAAGSSAQPEAASAADRTGARAVATGSADRGTLIESLGPVRARIVGGRVVYVDERSGLRHDVDAITADVEVRDARAPVDIKGSLAWRGELLAFEGRLSQLRDLLEDHRARLQLRVAGRPGEASYEGGLVAGPGGVALEGSVSLKAPSLEALGAWIGKPIAPGRETGAFSLSSSISSGGGRTALAGLAATLGDISLTGDLTIGRRDTRPYASGALKLSRLDLGGILIRQAQAPAGQPGQPTQVRGFSKRAGSGSDWSDDVIDLAPLGLADAELALSADTLQYKDVRTGPARLSLRMMNNVAMLALEDMQLYGGRGRGMLTLDGSGQAPATVVNLTMEGISALPLLKDALGFEWLEGKGAIAVALTGRGVSERQIIQTLNGKVDLALTNGFVDAIDVGRILRGIEQGRFSGLRTAAGDKTPFSELAGTFTIANGIADNKDLRLVSENLRVAGAGSFNLPGRSLDYTVRPKIAALNATTDRAVINLSNVEIPVRIEGPWDKPNFSVAGQEQILETVRQIGKGLKSQDVEDAVKGLLGGDGQQKVKPRDILEKLFKKQ